MSTRLFVSGALINGAAIEVEGDRARYLGRVLRARTGDEIRIFDGEGLECAATIERIQKHTVTLRVGEAVDVRTESPLGIHLVQGISRGDRMDFVVQKATELGVTRITPVLTEYGVVRLESRRAAKRREHWHQVAISACEQCGRARLPLIDDPVPLRNWLGDKPADADVELVLAPGAAEPLARVPAPGQRIRVLIGPEGGFSGQEYDNAAMAGFRSVSVGPRILRTETAAVAVLGILQSRWGDLA